MIISYSLSYFMELAFITNVVSFYNYFGYLFVLWHIRSIAIFFLKSSHFSRKSLVILKEFLIFTSNFHYVKNFFPETLYFHQFRFLFGIIFAIGTIILFKTTFFYISREISLISRSFSA